MPKSQLSAAPGAVAELCRHIGLTVRTMPERRMIADTPQVFFPDFNTFILFKLLPDKRIQFIKAAAAGSLSNIPGIPPENRYEKYVEIPVRLIFVHGQLRMTDIQYCYKFLYISLSCIPKSREKHMPTLFCQYFILLYIQQRNNIKSYFSLLTCYNKQSHVNRSLDNVLAVIGSRGLKITAPPPGHF